MSEDLVRLWVLNQAKEKMVEMVGWRWLRGGVLPLEVVQEEDDEGGRDMNGKERK